MIDFVFEINKVKFHASLVFNFVMMPRNLESSHVLLNKELINANFDKFAEILRKSTDFNKYIENFY